MSNKLADNNLEYNAKNLFLKYVTFDTQSNESSETCPSTVGQRIFAEFLVEQLKEIGLQDVSIDENSYVMATLPGNCNTKKIPAIGFIAHLDTSPDMSGKDVKPQIINYEGGNIILNKEQNIILSPDIFPDLNDYRGQELIVTDGNTLLGADDKAGMAAIVSAMKYFIDNPDIQHGTIRIAFTPDEETGHGADKFDVEKFDCEWAYTVDGGAIGEFEYENFNAASVKLTFNGRNIHPGYAKNKMINAIQVAIDFHESLPKEQNPSKTEGYEGFFHLTSFSGTVEKAELSYIIRDHDKILFENKKLSVVDLVKQISKKNGTEISFEIKDQYFNMREIVEPRKEIIDLACKAMKACNINPVIKPVRGGTDGARLSFMNLPCPNLFAGGINFHGRYEFLPVRSLEKSRETIIKIIELLVDFIIYPSEN